MCTNERTLLVKVVAWREEIFGKEKGTHKSLTKDIINDQDVAVSTVCKGTMTI